MIELNNLVKHNGVIYTPEWIVKIVHDKTLPNDLADIAVCDPACGDGAFLIDVAERICKQAVQSKDQHLHIKSLQKLAGFDTDAQALDYCRDKLDKKVKEFLPDLQIEWDLQIIDGIDQKQWRSRRNAFDYVVGNPPYVRIQHLEEERRKVIRNGEWSSLSGCTDLYILFYEYGLKLLKEGGSLCFITPNSWMKNNAGKSLRDFLGSFDVNYILDFDDYQVFKGVATYTAITKISKAPKSNDAKAEKFKRKRIKTGFRLAEFRDKWICVQDNFRVKFDSSKDKALGDVAKIQVGIQTLADKVFILPVIRHEDGEIVCLVDDEEVPIETGVAKRILKASVMRKGKDKVNRIIIFPYDKSGVLMPEAELKEIYPLAYKWLKKHKSVLLNRDKGKHRQYKWYEYGRSVGVKTGFGRKILTSGMNKKPNFQLCNDADALFYSGYSIKPKPGVEISKLLNELNSPLMEEYIESISKPFQHGWRSYAKSYIQDYPVNYANVTR